MRLELTREQAILEHRKMWYWIADQYESGQCECPYLMKDRYIRTLGIGYVENKCFCCEYVFIEEYGDCNKCPINFGYGDCACDRNVESPYRKLCDCWFGFSGEDRNTKYMAELARQIASLPERKV
ncbi:MAG: hypothetical protein ACI4F9_01075 [Lachnospiraceae bacterium]